MFETGLSETVLAVDDTKIAKQGAKDTVRPLLGQDTIGTLLGHD